MPFTFKTGKGSTKTLQADPAGVRSIPLCCQCITAVLPDLAIGVSFPRQEAYSRLACLAQGAREGTLGALHTVQLEVGLSACAFNNLQKLLQFLRLTLLATPALLIIMIIVLTCIRTGNLATWPLLFTIIIIPIAVGEPYTVKAFPTVGLGLERKASTEFSDAEANTHQQCSSGLLGAS